MSNQPDNPPAFPSDIGGLLNPGMTLWHWFAGQALAGHCAIGRIEGVGEPSAANVVDWSIECADLMMAEHEKRFGRPDAPDANQHKSL